MPEMQATPAEIAALVRIQERDTQTMRLQARLSELPEVKQIAACRTKRKELKGKQDQVVELADDVEAKLAKLQSEEEQLVEKVASLQKKLDGTGDHRIVGSITKEMEGQVKRQAANAKEQDELLERQIKVDKLGDEVAHMVAQVDERERALTRAFQDKAAAIKSEMEEAAAERAALTERVPAPLMRRYEALRKEKGGIGLATIEGDHCSACRTTFLTGQMLKLKAASGLAECPMCHRLMAVGDDGADADGAMSEGE